MASSSLPHEEIEMTIAAASANVESPPSSTLPKTLPAPPRVDLFGDIHKAIRFALSELLGQMGRAVFTDASSVERIVAQLEDVLSLCEDHRGHEDRLIFPSLGTRLQGTLDCAQAAHACRPVQIAELHALAEALRAAIDPRRQLLAGRTLYLHFSTFTAELLLHMAEEERVVQPLLEHFFTDDELDEVHGQLLAALTPEEKMRSAPWLLRAMNPEELSKPQYADLVSSAGL
jgi:iron-sulfur cluster repair protein YtfE (RIC family)